MDLRTITSLDGFRHKADVQLRFNDVDILGHVNNTVYFSFYDMGKALYFHDVRADGFRYDRVDTIIANINCAYREPIYFGEQIEVLTRCEHIGDKSFVLLQGLRSKTTGAVKSLCETVMVGYDPDRKVSTGLPQTWRDAFCEYEGRDLMK